MANCPKCGSYLYYEPTADAPCEYCAFPNFISSTPYYPPQPVFYPQYSYNVPPPYLQPQPPYWTPVPVYQGFYPPQYAPTPVPTQVPVQRFITCDKCGGTDSPGTGHVCFPDLPSPLRLNNSEINTLKAEHNAYIHQYRSSRFGPIMDRVGKSESMIHKLDTELALRNRIITAAMENQQAFGNFPLPTEFDVAGARYLVYVIRLLAGQEKRPPGMPKPPRVQMMDSLTVAVGTRSDGKGLNYALSGSYDGQKIELLHPEIQAFCGSVYQKFYSINTHFYYEQSIGKSSSHSPETYQIRECAEPKLWGDLDMKKQQKKKEKLRYRGMTTLWAGSARNPYPLIPELTDVGSPMLPCPRCVHFSGRI